MHVCACMLMSVCVLFLHNWDKNTWQKQFTRRENLFWLMGLRVHSIIMEDKVDSHGGNQKEEKLRVPERAKPQYKATKTPSQWPTSVKQASTCYLLSPFHPLWSLWPVCGKALIGIPHSELHFTNPSSISQSTQVDNDNKASQCIMLQSNEIPLLDR